MAEGSLKEALVAKVESFFAEEDWGYSFDERINGFKAGISLRSKLRQTDMYIICKDDALRFSFTISVGTDEENEIPVMEFITRANYGLNYGGFQMNLDRNYIEYTLYLPCEDVPSNTMIGRTIFTGINMLNHYGNELLAVMFGMKSAQDAIEEVENKGRG